jgi:hypothetical protein
MMDKSDNFRTLTLAFFQALLVLTRLFYLVEASATRGTTALHSLLTDNRGNIHQQFANKVRELYRARILKDFQMAVGLKV